MPVVPVAEVVEAEPEGAVVVAVGALVVLPAGVEEPSETESDELRQPVSPRNNNI